MLILIFSVGLGWLPGGLRLGFEVTAPPTVTGLLLVDSLLARNWEALWAAMKHLLLPALALGAPLAALTMRITRSSMLDVIQQDYITFARAKGLKEGCRHHQARPAQCFDPHHHRHCAEHGHAPGRQHDH